MKKNQLIPAIFTASMFLSIVAKAQQTTSAKDSVVKKDSALVLTGVTVTSQKQFIEQAAGKLVLNVSASPVSAGTNAYEVLLKAPGMIEQEQRLQFRNKTVNVLINGRPSNLSGEELKAMLSAMPANTIEKVEVLTNASASYDAQGGVVVDIRLAKNKNLGTNGVLTLGAGAGMYGRYNGGVSLNNRSKKTNIYGSYDANATTQYNKSESFRLLDANTAIDENEFSRQYRESHVYKLGMDHDINKSSSIGILFKGMNNTRKRNADNTSLVDQLNGIDDSSSTVFTAGKTKISNPSLNLYYRLSSAKGNELVINADYFSYQKNWDDAFTTRYFDDKHQSYRNDYLLRNHSEGDINVKSISADYTHNNKAGRWEMGLKTTFNTTDNNTIWEYHSGGNWVNDAGKTNHFIYKENINAAYVNLNKDFERLSVQLGLRFENTISKGNQMGNAVKPDSSFSRDYNNLFPTVYLTYKLDSASNHQLGLNYGRRISRPFYRDLNPFISPLDKFTYYVGNPFLKPAFTDNVELSYTFKQRITATFSYGRTHDDVGETIEIVDGTYFSRPGNLSTVVVKSYSIDGSQELAKWLTLNFYGEVTNIHSRSNFYTGLLDTKGTFWLVSPNAQFKFNKGWSAELSGFYRTDITTGQFISLGYSRVGAGIQKKLSPAITLKLNVNDIFYTQINKGIINNLALTDANYHNQGDTRNFALAFSWRFGKTIADQRKHNATGAEAEQNRVR